MIVPIRRRVRSVSPRRAGAATVRDMKRELRGLSVVVTGGARGIGRGRVGRGSGSGSAERVVELREEQGGVGAERACAFEQALLAPGQVARKLVQVRAHAMGQRAGELMIRRLTGAPRRERIIDLGFAVIERQSA